jgi:hypothetical protein
MSASEAIARLRELSAQHWAASGPFKMPPNTPIDELSLFGLNKNFLAAAAVTLPALLECAEAVQKIHDHLSDYIDARKTVDVSVAVVFETSRAALQALANPQNHTCSRWPERAA